MTPSQFEKYCLEMLRTLENKSENFLFQHNAQLKTNDGTFQIDVLIETAQLGGATIKTVVECKQYNNNNPIKRQQIQILNDNLKQIGAHKGIFISTSGYQKGAIDYAKRYGIALIQIVDNAVKYIVNSVHQKDLTDYTRDRNEKFILVIYEPEYGVPLSIDTEYTLNKMAKFITLK